MRPSFGKHPFIGRSIDGNFLDQLVDEVVWTFGIPRVSKSDSRLPFWRQPAQSLLCDAKDLHGSKLL